MLRRKTGLSRGTSTLKTSSRLKCNKSLSSSSSLRSNSSLSRGNGLAARSTLKATASLHTNTQLSAKGSSLQTRATLNHGKAKLKKNSYKRTVTPSELNQYLALPKAARIQNQAVIDACRRPTCEICGRPAGGEPHHIITRGAGGPDIPENLIQLCRVCHTKAHTGELEKTRIMWAVANRLRKTPSAVEDYVDKVMKQGYV